MRYGSCIFTVVKFHAETSAAQQVLACRCPHVAEVLAMRLEHLP